MKIGVVLISHGYMAKETLNSAQMIMGSIDNVHSFAMLSGYGIETTREKLNNLLDSLTDYDEVIIFADILGGTPCNIAFQEIVKKKKFKLVSGFNLGIVIETLTLINTNSKIDIDNIVQSGKSTIKNISAKIDDMK